MRKRGLRTVNAEGWNEMNQNFCSCNTLPTLFFYFSQNQETMCVYRRIYQGCPDILRVYTYICIYIYMARSDIHYCSVPVTRSLVLMPLEAWAYFPYFFGFTFCWKAFHVIIPNLRTPSVSLKRSIPAVPKLWSVNPTGSSLCSQGSHGSVSLKHH
jgi:hypothetical protein